MKKIVIIILSLYPSFYLQAQEKVVSLNEIIEKVQSDFPSIKQSQYNIESLIYKSEGVKSWMSPVFSVGFSRVPYDYSVLSNTNSKMNQAGISFGIQQMIPDYKKQNASSKYYLSLTEIEKCNAEKQKNELRLTVKLMYYNRLIAEKKISVIDNSIEIFNFLIKTETEKLAYNKSNLITIYKAKARIAELNNMKLMLLGMINESNAGINILMQRDANFKFNIDTSQVYFKYYNSINIDRKMVRSDFEAMNYMIQSMKLEQQAMKLKLRPEFGVKAEHMQMVAMPSQWALMGMFSMPIKSLTDKMINSEVKSMECRIKAMDEEKSAMKIMIDKMTTEKLEIIKSRYKMYQNYKDEVLPQFEKNLEVNLYSYRQSTNDFSNVLDALEMLNMKKIELLDIESGILKNEAEYEYEKEIK